MCLVHIFLLGVPENILKKVILHNIINQHKEGNAKGDRYLPQLHGIIVCIAKSSSSGLSFRTEIITSSQMSNPSI